MSDLRQRGTAATRVAAGGDAAGATATHARGGDAQRTKSSVESFSCSTAISSFFKARGEDDGFASLDGLRTLLCLWMIAFHTFFYASYFLTDAEASSAGSSAFLTLVVLGFLPVDGFNILTGFLIAHPLYKRLREGKDPPSLTTLWYRRVTRMMPVYLVAYVLFHFVFFYHGQFKTALLRNGMHQDVARSFNITESWPSSCENFSFVANALFLNNLMPFGGCMGYSWTMALNFQFYFFFPLLIVALWRRVSPRVICVTVVLLSFIARLVAFQSLRVHTIGTPEGFFFTFFWYTNSFTRVGTLFFGALLADLCASTSFVEGVRARRWLQGLCWAIVAATLVCQRMWNQWFRAPLPSITAPGANAVVFAQQGSWVGAQLFFYSSILVGGPLSAFIFAWLTFCILNRVGAIGRALNALCSFSLFAPLSQLTFFAYLLHPMIMVKLFSTLLYPPRWTPLDVARHILVMMVSTFSLALVLHLLLERPLEFLLRRGEGKWPRLQRMVTAYSTLCMVLSVLAHVASAYIILTAQPKA